MTGVSITLRANQTLPLTTAQVDGNFKNLKAGIESLGSASGVTFTPAGAGAVPQSLESKARESPSFADRGAIAGEDSTDKIQSALNIGYGYVGDAIYTISAPLKIPSLSYFEGARPGTAITGNVANVKAAIKKTNNALAQVTNFETHVTTGRDCIAYIAPEWIDNGVSYPQKATLERLSLQGNQSAPNGYGLYIEQGGGFALRDMDVTYAVNGYYAKDAWLSVLDRFHTTGKITQTGGTSMLYTACEAGNGYSFSSLIYSAVIASGSDDATDAAYRYVNSKMVTVAAGSEGTNNPNVNEGADAHYGSQVVHVGRNIVPMANQATPIRSSGGGSVVTYIGGSDNFGVAGVTGPDFLCNDSNDLITFVDHEFVNGTFDSPLIKFATGVGNSRVIVHYGDNHKVYTSDGTGATKVETFRDSGTFTPTLSFNGGTTGMAYTVQTGTWQKNGKIVTVSGRIQLSNKGTSTGVAILSGWPAAFKPLGDVLVNFSLVTGITGGPIIGTVDIGGTQAVLAGRGATGDASMAEGNFTNTSLLRFNFSFTIA